MMTLIEDILTVLAPIGAAIAFLIGLRKYSKGQNWLKARFMLSMIESFEKDKKINMACKMLDWDERDLDFSEGKTLHIDNKMLVSALRVVRMDIESNEQPDQITARTTFTKEESCVRDAFDTFFDFFDRLYALEKSGLLSFSDLWYFYYWFELLCHVGEHKKDPTIQKAFDNYIVAYNFVGLRKFIEKYKKDSKARVDYEIHYDLKC